LKFEQIAGEVLAATKTTNEQEDAQFGEARGDELPEQLRTPDGRREFFRDARRQMPRDREREGSEQAEAPVSEEPHPEAPARG